MILPRIIRTHKHDAVNPFENHRSFMNDYWTNRRLLAAVLVAVCGIGSGCQSLGFRNSKEASDLAYDDWAISSPQINPPKVKTPVPSAYAKRKQAEQEAASNADEASAAATDAPVAAPSPAAEPTPTPEAAPAPEAAVVPASAEVPVADPSAVKPASAEEPVATGEKSSGPVKVSLNDLADDEITPTEGGDGADATKSEADSASEASSQEAASTTGEMNVIDAGVDEIDFEGALADLPAPYRDLLRRQLQAAQSTQKDGQGESDAGSANVVSDATANNITTSSKVAVKASLSDAIASEGAFSDGVTTASSETATLPASESLGASVLTASATVPLDRVATDSPVGIAPAGNGANEISFSQWNQALAQSIELLQKQIAETPASDENLRFHHEIALRMLFVASRRLDEACTPVDGMSNEENEYLRHQMQALYEASNPDAMPVRSRHLSLVMNSQREATNQLAAASNLEVRSAAFCTEVERFGVVTKFPKYQFVEDQEVLLYCEIENVAAKALKDGFETQLQGSYEIFDSQGNRVSEQILPMEPDFCQNHRRDYFIVYQIYMPQQIQPGNYKLRLTIEDMNARKFGQSTLDFQIKK